MTSFSSKRKPRAIRTFGDDDDEQETPTTEAPQSMKESPAPAVAPLKFGKRPLKQSSLRKSINAADAETLSGTDPTGPAPTAAPASSTATKDGDDDDEDGPAVVRPALSRAGSTKRKKRLSSRLSFGGGAPDACDDGGHSAAGGGGAYATPKKASLSAKAFENSASLRGRLPLPAARRQSNTEDDRPLYSKEYLDELASSTPNTPRDISTLKVTSDEDELMLDASELEGAMVVPSSELGGGGSSTEFQRLGATTVVASVLTDAQIRERKERRARIAQEQEFMPLDGSDDEENDYISLRTKTNKKDESRLIAEDEDLGEGYDEFVEDGGLSLGKKAEREARRRHRVEMAELINAAEGEDDASSDDSEAERRAAYEEAQTRAGMDGLHHRRRRKGEDGSDDYDEDGAGGGGGSGGVVIPKMKPLPDLGECLAKMQALLKGMENDVAVKRGRIADLEKEKEEILAREVEVQAILDQAGKKYQSAMGTLAPVTAAAVALSTGQSPLRPLPLPSGFVGQPVERGLESFGTTPTRRAEVDDVG